MVERLLAVVLRQRGQIGIEPNPLTSTQTLALAAASDAGPLRLGELAERIGTTDATASRTVDALVDEKLVKRTQDPRDRRGVRIDATAKGRRVMAERREQLTAMAEQLLVGLAEAERARVTDVLAELNDLLETPALIGEDRTAPATEA
jgi:DNA-binding MarR family transcriptional regulator